MKTYRDNYPCGRKFCSRCKRWRLVYEFQVRQWADEPYCTVPKTLTSLCTCCMRVRNRVVHGSRPANWYQNGVPGSERARLHRNARKRKMDAQHRKSKTWRDKKREYERIWANAKSGKPIRQSAPEIKLGIQHKSPHVDRAPFDEWRRECPLSDEQLALAAGINESTLRKKNATMSLETVDKVFTALGMPDQVAVLWPTEEAA